MNQYEIELRDKIALMFLDALSKEKPSESIDLLAKYAYSWADTMMETRKTIHINLKVKEEMRRPCDYLRGDFVKIGDEGYGIIDDILIKVRRPDGSIVTQDDRDVHKYIHQETGHKVQGTECNR